MPSFSADQLRALHARAESPALEYYDRFNQGIRDAEAQLATILRLHADDQATLLRNLRAYLAEGPCWDSEDYLDGGACVHQDVEAILNGYREVIAELLDTISVEGARGA